MRNLHISGFELAATLFVGLVVGLGMALFGWPQTPASSAAQAASVARGEIQFTLCHTGGGINCVVDGDTIWMQGVKIRIADIDTAETHPSRCAAEADLGERATRRLQALLNAGPIKLEPIERDEDRYGRKLRIVVRNGVSLGDILVDEGLARRYRGGPREGWC